jgi:tripeptidyl-peptidase-1
MSAHGTFVRLCGDEFLRGDVNNMLAAFDKYYCGMLNSSVDPIFPDSTRGVQLKQ